AAVASSLALLGASSLHADPLVRAPDANLMDVRLADEFDSSASNFARCGRVARSTTRHSPRSSVRWSPTRRSIGRIRVVLASGGAGRSSCCFPGFFAGRLATGYLNQRAPDLAPQREHPPEFDTNDEPRLGAPVRVEHHAKYAVDAEPGMPEAVV